MPGWGQPGGTHWYWGMGGRPIIGMPGICCGNCGCAAHGGGAPVPSGGAPIPAAALTCFNLGGNDKHGQPFTKEYSVKEGMVGALWFGADIPADLGAKGTYKGTITVTAAGGHSRTLSLTLEVAVPADGKPLALHGDADVYKMRRLRWLDSTLGADGKMVILS